MRDSLTRENATDFHRRYAGTFGYLLHNNSKLFVYVDRVSDDEVFFRDEAQMTYNTVADSGVEFEFIPVDRGFYNSVKGLRYLARVPARQWHRGISPHNTNLFNTVGGVMFPQSITHSALADIFVRGVDVHAAMENYYEGRSSEVALSKHFAISGNVLMFAGQSIGHVVDRMALVVTRGAVAQELRDCVRRNAFNFEVKNG